LGLPKIGHFFGSIHPALFGLGAGVEDRWPHDSFGLQDRFHSFDSFLNGMMTEGIDDAVRWAPSE
jgi:hypothetical protein